MMRHCPRFKGAPRQSGSRHPKGSPLLPPRRDRTLRRWGHAIYGAVLRSFYLVVGVGRAGAGIGWAGALRFIGWSGRVFDIRDIIDALTTSGLL